MSQKSFQKSTFSDSFRIWLCCLQIKKKNGIDTTHALSKIFKKYGIRFKSLGLKDASAITEQFVVTTSKIKHDFLISESRYSLKKIGFTSKTIIKKRNDWESF